MGHKRHREFRGGFVNHAPGLTGPGITEPDYPAYMPDIETGRKVTISLEHPENNPPGVTIEEFTEEVPRDSFGINVGQKMEDLLKEHATQSSTITTPNQEEPKKMEETKNNSVNNINEKETKMNKETKVNQETKNTDTAPNQEQPKTDPKVEQDAPKKETEQPKQETPKVDEDLPDPNKKYKPEDPHSSLGKEAAGAFTVGASYGAGVIIGMAAGALLVYGVKKLFCGSEDTGATQTAEAEAVSRFF